MRQQEQEIQQLKQGATNYMRTSGPAPEPERPAVDPRAAAATAAAAERHEELRRLEAAVKAARDDKDAALTARAEAEAAAQGLRSEHRRLGGTIAAAQGALRELGQRHEIEQAKFSSERAAAELQLQAAAAKARRPPPVGAARAAAEAEGQRLRAQAADLRRADEGVRARARECAAAVEELERLNSEHTRALREALAGLDAAYPRLFAALGLDPRRAVEPAAVRPPGKHGQ